jgi:hypothetical protein
MEDETDVGEEPTEEAVEEAVLDPVAQVLDLLSRYYPDSIPVNVMVITEWIEPDGSGDLSCWGTPMSPWLAKGLLAHVLEEELYTVGIVQEQHDGEEAFADSEDDEDDF